MGNDKDVIDVMLEEYKTLREEMIFYEKSLRSIHVFLATLLAGCLASFSVEKLKIIAVIFPPLFLITVIYGLNDIYQMFVMAIHIEKIEETVNKLLNFQALTWESATNRIPTLAFSQKRGKIPPIMLTVWLIGDFVVAAFSIPLFILCTKKGFDFIQQYSNVNTHAKAYAYGYLVLNAIMFLLVGFCCIYCLLLARQKTIKNTK